MLKSVDQRIAELQAEITKLQKAVEALTEALTPPPSAAPTAPPSSPINWEQKGKRDAFRHHRPRK